MKSYEPTAEEIEQVTALIRAGWSEIEHRQRAVGNVRSVYGLSKAEAIAEACYWTPPEVGVPQELRA